MIKSATTFILLFSLFTLKAQIVDTISVYSNKMRRDIKNVVILPQNYIQGRDFAVLYLLHGYEGNYATWINKIKKTLPQEASKFNMIIVCPDGQNSWYWDSPIDSTMQFETYLSEELVNYIDNHYNTIKNRSGRAITGFSMGGHGGLWLGINHPDVFGACGSMSGGVDIRPFPNSWEIKKRLGSYEQNSQIWSTHTVINQVDKIDPNQLSIIIDCGENDFFYRVNELLHKKLLYRDIPHDYFIRPGSHNISYWALAIDYQLLFFSRFFNK